MTLGNDPMQETPFILKERRPFSLTLTCEKADKSRLDLTGASFELVISDTVRKGGDAKVTVPGVLISAADGTVRFDVQASAMDFGKGMYDLAISLTTAEDYKSSIVEGPLELTHNPDPVVPDAFTEVVSPQSLTVRFRDRNRITVRVNHQPDSVLLDRASAAATSASAAQLAADAAAASAVAASGYATTATSAVDLAVAAGEALQDVVDGLGPQVAAAVDTINDAASAGVGSVNTATSTGIGAVEAERDDAIEAITDQEAASILAVQAASIGIVNVEHGNDPSVVRPDYPLVHWIGEATPANAEDWDFLTRSNI